MKDLALNDKVLLENEFDCALQEIDMLFSTTSTELIGYPEYGMSLESFLWTLSPTTSELQKYITQQIDAFCPYAKKFGVNAQVQYYKGSYRSIYLVIITMKAPNGETAIRKYQYQ